MCPIPPVFGRPARVELFSKDPLVTKLLANAGSCKDVAATKADVAAKLVAKRKRFTSKFRKKRRPIETRDREWSSIAEYRMPEAEAPLSFKPPLAEWSAFADIS